MNASIVSVHQGDDAWAKHRQSHLNASEAAAVLGISAYVSRADLIQQKATGITPEIDDATARRFANGHEFEAIARPWAEEIIGSDLYPVVLAADVDGLPLSASLDGIDMLQTVTFEHKTGRADLLASLERGVIPEQYHPQMEQGLLLSGAERCLFMASSGDKESMRFAWYEPSAEMRTKLIGAWKQFDADVAAYQPEPTKLAPVAAVVEGFGALSLRVEGRVLASNLDAFKAGAEAFIARLPKPDDLQTDQDFADADSAVKACAEAESRIEAAKDAAQSQMADIDAAFRLADTLIETIRRARLALNKAVETEKVARKGSIVTKGVEAVRQHYAAINATLGEHAIGMPASLNSEIAASMKGLKSLDSMRDKVDAAVANAKIAASQKADAIRANIAVINASAHAELFPDRVQLCATKSAEDLRNLIATRIVAHEKIQAEKLEAERARIREEELERIEQEQKAKVIREAATLPTMPAEQVGQVLRNMAAVAQPVEQPPCSGQVAGSIPAGGSTARIKLGDICAAIAPLSITADGLAQLGFNAVAHDRAAKLYAESDLPSILRLLSRRLDEAAITQAWAA